MTEKGARRGHIARTVLGVLSALVAVAAAVVIVALVFFPNQAEQVAGQVKVTFDKVTSTTTLPTVTLKGKGGMRELDAAGQGVFVEMTAYRTPGLQPTYAAHDTHGGDIILTWSTGDHVEVVKGGHTTEWVVTDTRNLPKVSEVTRAKGMTGDILLQTCYYGRPVVKFVALTPLAKYNAARPTSTPASVPAGE